MKKELFWETVAKCRDELSQKLGMNVSANLHGQLAYGVAVLRLTKSVTNTLDKNLYLNLKEALKSAKPAQVYELTRNWAFEWLQKPPYFRAVRVKNPTYLHVYTDNTVELFDAESLAQTGRASSIQIFKDMAQAMSNLGAVAIDGVIFDATDTVAQQGKIYCFLPKLAERASAEQRKNAIALFPPAATVFKNVTEDEIAAAIRANPADSVVLCPRIGKSIRLIIEYIVSSACHDIPLASGNRSIPKALASLYPELGGVIDSTITLYKSWSNSSSTDERKQLGEQIRACLKSSLLNGKYHEFVVNL